MDAPSVRDCSEIAPQRLLALDRLEEGLEVALAEAARALALDHLEEDGRPVLRVAGEDLQQVAVFVTIDQDAQPRQRGDRLIDLAHAPFQVSIVARDAGDDLHALAAHALDGRDDVLRDHGDMLHAWAAIVVQILFDLRLALAMRRLVDRDLDLARATFHHLGHQRGVLGADSLVGEVDDLREAQDALVEADPLVHRAQLYISADVVDGLDARI